MIHYERAYECSDEEAFTRLQSLGRYWKKKWGIEPNWRDSTANFDGRIKGVKFKGTVKIGGGRVDANIEAGFLAEKLGAKRYVSRKVDDYLNLANSLESLDARVPA